MYTRQTLTYLFVLLAMFVGILSLLLSNKLVKELSEEERDKLAIWVLATKSVALDDTGTDMSLVLSILRSNTTIPIILHDENSGKLLSHNIRLPQEE
ncbi:MAG: ATP-binding protein, partial [Proteiniphilum sp.]|nr:ATP-binding protein [Proteiniphilum sp.]